MIISQQLVSRYTMRMLQNECIFKVCVASACNKKFKNVRFLLFWILYAWVTISAECCFLGYELFLKLLSIRNPENNAKHFFDFNSKRVFYTLLSPLSHGQSGEGIERQNEEKSGWPTLVRGRGVARKAKQTDILWPIPAWEFQRKI